MPPTGGSRSRRGLEPADPSNGVEPVEEGSAYGIVSPSTPSSPRLTSLERAVAIADYWRLKSLALLEENLLLKKQAAGCRCGTAAEKGHREGE